MLFKTKPKIMISEQQAEQLVDMASRFDVKPGSPIMLNVKLRSVHLPENQLVDVELAPADAPLDPCVVNLDAIAHRIKLEQEFERARLERFRKSYDFSNECDPKPAPMIAVALGTLAVIGGMIFLAAKAIKQSKK